MAKSKVVSKVVSKALAKTNVLGFTLTTPAVVAFIAYIVLALVIILPFEIPLTDQETGIEYIVKYDFAQRVIILLLMSIPIALSVYTINCMMAGNCTLWSYVVSVLTVFWIALFIIATLIYTLKKK
jgi:hypothetical protein